MVKRKSTKRKRKIGSSDSDAKTRRKYAKGGRIEAYTFGEALSGKNWP